MWQLRATPGLNDGLHMVDGGRRPRGKLGMHIEWACIGPVADWQKPAREVLLNALRGRSRGLYLADDQSVGYMEL
jgi:hypothetical protein